MLRRLALLSLLYLCQGLPGGFLAVALPIMLLEQGVSLTGVGFVSLLSLPWMLKVLWAPVVDRFGSRRLGRRKVWMLPAMTVMVLCTVALGACDPVAQLPLVLALFFVLNLAAATQDIAVDGFAVGLLHGRDLGPANSAQVGGFKLGNLLGGGVLLALSPVLGWRGAFACMTAILVVALVAVTLTQERDDDHRPVTRIVDVVRGILRELVAQPKYAGFLVLAKLCETLGGALVKPAMQRQGFTREMIGTIDGIYGSVATVLGAIAGGALARRYGWAPALCAMATIQGAALVVIGVYQAGEVSQLGFAVRLAVENFAGGGVGVAVFMLAMSKCRPEVGATQFTAAQVVYMSGAAIAGPIAGVVADATSIAPVMIAGGLGAVVVGFVALRFRAQIERGS
jgi:MFS family permease